MMAPRPLLVVGSPRSGTTLIGTLVGSAVGAIDLGEYAGYDFCHRIARAEMADMPGAATRDYLRDLTRHAHDFPRQFGAGHEWFVASAPWNLLVAEQIRQAEPDALFVLCHRRVEGVCQSLRRSYESGRLWAGEHLVQRIDLWCDFYANVGSLPEGRTVILDYDQLCAAPRDSAEQLLGDLEALGYPARSSDLSVFARSHATQSDRPTVAALLPEGELTWTSRSSWDAGAWGNEDQVILDSHDRFRAIEAEVRRSMEQTR
jgi:hypothetical protein